MKTTKTNINTTYMLKFIIKMLSVGMNSAWFFCFFVIMSTVKVGTDTTSAVQSANSDLALIFTFQTIAFSYLGYLVVFLCDKFTRKLKKTMLILVSQKVIAGIIMILALVPLIYFYWANANVLLHILFFVCHIFAYIIGYRNYSVDYEMVLYPKWITVTTVAPIITILYVWFLRLEVSYVAFVLIYVIGISVNMIARSQANIDFLMNRRKHNMQNLPKSIRKYTLMLCGGFIILLFASILLRDIALWGMDIVFIGLREAIIFIVYIMSMLSQGEEGTTETGGDLGGGASLLPSEENPNATLINVLTLIFFAGIVLFLIINYRREILSAIKKILMIIFSFVHKFFASTPLGNSKIIAESDYYYDDVKTVDPLKMSIKKDKKTTVKSLKREYKNFMKMPTSELKYRCGYQLILKQFQIRGVNISRSDTPNQILQKCKSIIPESKMDDVTKCYNRVRYSDIIPQGPVYKESELEDMIFVINKLM